MENKQGSSRDEKRQHRLSMLGFPSNRSNDSSDSRTERPAAANTNNNTNNSTDTDTTNTSPNSPISTPLASLPTSSQASTSQRAEKQSARTSTFRMRNPFLIGGEKKSRTSNVARMPSPRPSRGGDADVEEGANSGVMREKQSAGRTSIAPNVSRNESQMSIPGAFRMHANGMIDDDPTVYSQNTKETGPFYIDHASLVDGPHANAHLASGGAIPTDYPYTNGSTGGPSPNRGGYQMPDYGFKRSITPYATPSPSTSPTASEAPIGIGIPVSGRRPDGMRMNQRQIRLMFLMLAVAVIALVTGIAVAIDSRSQEVPVAAVSSANEEPLDWNDDNLSYRNSGDMPDAGSNDGNGFIEPTLSPVVQIKDSRGNDSTPAPSARATSKPTIDKSESPTQTPTSPAPTTSPTTPKPTRPLETYKPSSTPTESHPSTSPTSSSPTQSPTVAASATPSVTVTTAFPTTFEPSQSPSRRVTSSPTLALSTPPSTVALSTSPPTLAPSKVIIEMERTVGHNDTNLTAGEEDNAQSPPNMTDSNTTKDGDFDLDSGVATNSGNRT